MAENCNLRRQAAAAQVHHIADEQAAAAAMRPMPDRITQFLDRARALKLRIPFSPRQLRKVRGGPQDVEGSGGDQQALVARRPAALQKPSAATVGLVSELMSHLYTTDQHLNHALVTSNLALCEPSHDLLLIEDTDHYNIMHKAIIFGDLQLVHTLLEHGVNVNGLKSRDFCWQGLKHCSHENLGALHLASFLGRCDIVSLLLERGADITLQMKVFTSAVVNDPLGLQPDIFSSVQSCKAADIISKCGCREAVFYAVLNNQVDVVKILLRAQRNDSSRSDNRYLCHLSCRVGAYECFEFLLREYPRAINTKDTDGLPLLLMALNNNMRFVKLLLDQECDIHVLDDFWEPGTNIIHLLFHGVTTQNPHSLKGLHEITEKCLKRGANVNGQRLPSKATPLHDLMRAVNCPMETSHKSVGESYLDILETIDDELISCLSVLFRYGADVHVRDSNNKTPLQVLLSNGMHTVRCNASKDGKLGAEVHEALCARSYGLENTLSMVRLLIAHGAITNNPHAPIMEDFVELIQASYFGTSDSAWAWMHSFEILQEDAIFDKYIELTVVLLSAGADPNLASQSELPPLLYLLSHIAESPYTSGYLIDVDTAQRLHKLIGVLIDNGARTEAQIDMHGTGKRVIGCFDMLTSLLQTLRNHHRPVEDLEVLYVLACTLIQHGASTNVFQKLLYFIPDRPPHAARRPLNACTSMPKHTFFFQYILFGMFNLRYVNQGGWYLRIFNVFYCQIEHYTLNDVLSMAQAQFCSMHADGDCECGQCDNFRALLDSVKDTPRSLKILCRLSIYDSVRGKLKSTVPRLPLPTVLKMYLMSFQP